VRQSRVDKAKLEHEDGTKNATFCAIYTHKRTFYQDRLGTNIGKVEKRVAYYFLGVRVLTALLAEAARIGLLQGEKQTR
jgi:hypothetical protein